MRRSILLLLLPAAVALAGCGGGSSTSGGGTASSASAAAPRATIKVSEREFSITPRSLSVPSTGTYAFAVRNTGMIGHALEIEGHGVEKETDTIGPGSSATLTVDLSKAGSYEVYCPIDAHRDKGMKATLTVGGPGASSGGGMTTTGGTTTGGGGPGY